MRTSLGLVIPALLLAAAPACNSKAPERRAPPTAAAPAAGTGAAAQPASGGPAGAQPTPRQPLRSVESFASIADKAERSRALFGEMSRVLQHPRCLNCHPSGDVPAQGNELQPHDPPVVRGPDDHGVVGMRCDGCHQDHNLDHARVPGAPGWHLAPIEMAWVGKSAAYICNQIKDPKRNGGKTLQRLIEHNGHDELVAWGWKPGHGREPAPGTQEQFGQLTQAWVDTGAECPPEEKQP